MTVVIKFTFEHKREFSRKHSQARLFQLVTSETSVREINGEGVRPPTLLTFLKRPSVKGYTDLLTVVSEVYAISPSYHEATIICSRCCSVQLSTGMRFTITIAGARLMIRAVQAQARRTITKIGRVAAHCTLCTALLTFQGGECCHQHLASCLSQPEPPLMVAPGYNANIPVNLLPLRRPTAQGISNANPTIWVRP